MRRKKKIILIPCLILFHTSLLFPSQAKTVEDALGHPFALRTSPRRIISLAPNITEILFALGLGERLVGVTRYCDYPPAALNIEKIGGLVDPNLEKIMALNPDLVVGFRGNPLKTLERLNSLGLPLFVLEMGETLDSVFPIIQKIGLVTRQEKEAEDLVRSMKERYNRIQEDLRDVEYEPRVFFSLMGMGLWTCGKDSFLDDLVQKAKGINIAGNIKRKWLHINREHLIHENPDVIVILSKTERDFVQAKKWIETDKHFQGLKAVVSNRIYFLDENIATRPGPRLIDAFHELARILHPQRFHERP